MPWSGRDPLRVSAAPGETEPATFVVYARRNVRRLDVRVSDLRSRVGRIPASAIVVREVLRTPTRRVFNRPETEIVGRFLPRLQPASLAARHFREIWIDVSVPADAAPGSYTGRVSIGVGRDEVTRTLQVRVRPIRLVEPADKKLGMYYRAFAKLQDPDTVRRELADMREHGISHLVTDLRPVFARDKAGAVTIDTSRLAQGMQLFVDAGFEGTVIVDSGLVPLARALGHDDVDYRGASGTSLEGDGGAAFREHALAALRAIRDEARRHPRLDLAVVHVDEIFTPTRLDMFVQFAEVSRRVPELPIFATFSTMTPEQDEWRARVDPFIDIRGNHGYTFEWWIARGRDWEDYATELRRSRDRAWFYHNERGTYFTPQWARIINGVYLWAGPFESHVTWAYQSFYGDPLDDTDGKMHDYGVAFPSPEDPSVLVPTRAWAAVREGWDDIRYLETLRVAVDANKSSAPDLAAEGELLLERLRADVLRVPGPIDPDTLRARTGTAGEAPYVNSLSRRYDAGRLAMLRERAEELVVALEVARGARRP